MDVRPFLLKTIVKAGAQHAGVRAGVNADPSTDTGKTTPADSRADATQPSPQTRAFIDQLRSLPPDEADAIVKRAMQIMGVNTTGDTPSKPTPQPADALSAMMMQSVQSIVADEVEAWMRQHLAKVVADSIAEVGAKHAGKSGGETAAAADNKTTGKADKAKGADDAG